MPLGILAIWWLPESGNTETVPQPRAVPLTSYPGIELGPSFSLDGDRVAFSWDGEKQDNFDIYVKIVGAANALGVGTGTPIRLTTDTARDFDPCWSPDGRFVAYLRPVSGDRVGVFLVPALGGTERKLADVAFAEFGYYFPVRLLNWSPNGMWLIVSSRDSVDDPFSLFLISADGASKRRLTQPSPEAMGDAAGSFSPDGRQLVFTRFVTPLVSDLYLLRLTDDHVPAGEPERLTFENQTTTDAIFTANGREVIVPSGQLSHGLWRIYVGDQTPLQRLTFGENGYSPALSRDGRRLTYVRWFNSTDIWKIELDESGNMMGDPTPLIQSSMIDTEPAYSPGGKRIAFMSTRSGSPEIWIAGSDGSNPTQITSVGGAPTGMPRWSPSGDRIAFDSIGESEFDVHVIDSSGGVPRRLTGGPFTELTPSWSRDGRWIYYTSNRATTRDVWKVPSDGGKEERVTRPPIDPVFEDEHP